VDNRRVLIAVLLSLAVLIGWQLLFPPPEPVPAPPPAAEAPVAETPEPAAEQGMPPVAAEAGEEAAAEAGTEAAAEAFEPVAADREREVVVETGLYRAVLTNRGGQVVSFVLKEHRSHDGELLDLVRRREDGRYPFALVDGAGEPLALNDQLFAVERSTVDGETRVVLRYSGDAGRAEKRFLFHEDGVFDLQIEVRQPREWALFVGPGLRNPSAEELEDRFAQRAAIYEAGEDVERLQPAGTEERTELPVGALRWVGLEDNYFLAALIPQAPLRSVSVLPFLAEPSPGQAWRFRPLPPEDELSEADEDLPRDLALLVAPVGESIDLRAYWGAKKYQRLKDLPYDLERTVTIWSWLRPIAVPILWGLLWIHDNVVHNYGWAIVLVTLVIKILLAPLTHKSFVSMRKMQELNPQMQAIRAKWRGKLRDKQGKMNLEAQRQMNEEMQQLYRTAGVNPAGGCVPMLLQMPVLFAFYQLLTAAVELRGAPWILWIDDLSRPDPFYALPIIMGATQFLQQRMTPMAGDPMQRRLMQAMPIVWTLFFLGFPSGLVLYWLTNNVLTILQQGILNRMHKKKDDESAPAAKPPKAQKGSRGSRRVASK
jgi:YidC/Oxa1 family membrane protein insertase